jgi:dihydrofolate reductase
MITCYNVISSDGYITRKDGSEDFIPDQLWPETLKIFVRFDVLVIGRKTYDAIQNYDEELLKSFEKLDIKKVVVTRDKNFQPKSGYTTVCVPEDVLRVGKNILISSGPTLNNYFLEKKLVDNIIFHQLPVSIGDGIRPFNTEIEKRFTLVSETQLGQVKEFVYQVPN